MKYLYIKDKKRCKAIYNKENQRKCYKYLIHNLNMPLTIKVKGMFLLDNLTRNSLSVHRKNFCIFTYRSRSFIKDIKASRIVLRIQASYGNIVGIKKASW